jgi:DNA-directed RNA polymerase subunit RPC12/RpoP
VAHGGDTVQQQEVACPHCGRAFTGDLIQGSAARYSGFKCPHCRLFVPYERAETEEAGA